MLDKYNEIFKQLKEEHNSPVSELNTNSRILIVDIMNLFIRGYAANPTTNEDGIHIGGISGSLVSLGYTLKRFNPTRVILAMEGKGGSQYRKTLFPGYKANRKKDPKKKKQYNRKFYYDNEEMEDRMMKLQLSRLFEYFECLPLTIVQDVNYIEADDTIAYIVNSMPESKHIIMSADKDFLQLCSDNVSVYSPTKKVLYNKENVLDAFGVPVHNLAVFRAIDGDASDGIPGIKGWAKKSILKNIDILKDSDNIYTLDSLFEHASKYNIQKIIDHKSIIERNYKLMQLKDMSYLSQSTQDKISKIINVDSIPRLVKYKFQKMVLEDKLFTAIKNSTVWLSQTFTTLDIYASRSNKEK